jgi:hypothetical protein
LFAGRRRAVFDFRAVYPCFDLLRKQAGGFSAATTSSRCWLRSISQKSKTFDLTAARDWPYRAADARSPFLARPVFGGFVQTKAVRSARWSRR